MAIALFEHNKAAYSAVLSMLDRTGKAAVVHPTGTGKSFIAFAFCEDHPDKKILWMSPSEYIFRTQLENLKAAGGETPGNITFVTYARFSMYTEEEIRQIHADALVLDEFHRAGAATWQINVRLFLRLFPDVPVLGLSATSIRYLDDQRDMAAELFDGHIASEMTLGEAIVRGILHPPKYVLAAFYYADGLKKYEKRIRGMRSRAARDAAESYLEALRRALEKADGLDVIFDKHMTDRTGKYIVFCANKEHMDEMMGKAGEWFSRVDDQAHIYSVYSEDPGASKTFQDFKEDQDDTHLRLLYCIDALNEGIHVADVSGVILLRPTVSPIIYKQQIGRALSAGKGRDAVIFDIVMNIENLYSIDTVREEMQDALTCYRYLGEDGQIVADQFRVVDEVQDCVALFDKLNETLTAPWNVMYGQAKNYFAQNGDLKVPVSYINEAGYSLGAWISNQRQSRRRGQLGADRIGKLDAIGMVWDRISDLRWEQHFAAAGDYYRAHGDLSVPVDYVSDDGVPLGKWLFYLRKTRRTQSVYLTPEQVGALDNIGMVWDVSDHHWERNYAAARDYYEKNGNLEVPVSYITEDGIRLGAWIQRLRLVRLGTVSGELTDGQIRRLDAIGMQWGLALERRWDQAYRACKAYAERNGANGALRIARDAVSPDGIRLAGWVQRQRDAYRKGKLPPEKQKLLEAIGITWEQADVWHERCSAAGAYYAAHHTLDIPADVVVGGQSLRLWLSRQKKKYDSEAMPLKRREQFEKLPLCELDGWMKNYEKAAAYYRKHGDLDVSPGYTASDGLRLYEWLSRQKKAKREGKLSGERTGLLEKLGITWETKEPWQDAYEHAKAYYAEHGSLQAPVSYVCADGLRLGSWLSKMRQLYRKGKLDAERIRLLEAIGMTWDARTERNWMKRFELAKAYYLEHGDLNLPPDYTKDGVNVSTWVIGQRMHYRRSGTADGLSEKQIHLLESIGMEWRPRYDALWDRRYAAFQEYYDRHGSIADITEGTLLADGRAGDWLSMQRKAYKEGKLAAGRIEKLNAIGMVWETESRWETGYRHAAAYAEENGNLDVPVKYVCGDGYRLGNWIANQRALRSRPSGQRRITDSQIRRLDAIGMVWNASKAAWETSYALAADYYRQNGHLHMGNKYAAKNGYSLGMWVYTQREKYRRGELPEEYKKRLDTIGMDWPAKRADQMQQANT